MAIPQEMPQPSVTEILLKITYLKFDSNFPGANELKWYTLAPGQAVQYWIIPPFSTRGDWWLVYRLTGVIPVLMGNVLLHQFFYTPWWGK